MKRGGGGADKAPRSPYTELWDFRQIPFTSLEFSLLYSVLFCFTLLLKLKARVFFAKGCRDKRSQTGWLKTVEI